MALSFEQKLAIYEMLEVPYATSYNVLDDRGTLVASTTVSASGQSAAKTAIDAAIVIIDSDTPAGILTHVGTICTDWIAIGNKTGKIENGSIGEIKGLTFDWDRKRQILKQKLMVVMTYFRANEDKINIINSSRGLNPLSVDIQR